MWTRILQGVFQLRKYSILLPPLQLAEVKVRILEAKQTLEECIAAQDFSRAAELKDSITELDNRRNQIIQETQESIHPAEKEVRVEKVWNNTADVTAVFLLFNTTQV